MKQRKRKYKLCKINAKDLPKTGQNASHISIGF